MLEQKQEFPAILLHGERGTGLWEGLLGAASALLCERAGTSGESTARPAADAWQLRACGACAGCHLVRAGTHPDLWLLLPAALRSELGLGAAEAEQGADKRSASAGREISIDEVRALIDWAQGTSHRGGAKVAVVHPLDAMAAPAANSLLKVLEEPPASLCFFTGTYRLDRVMPTLRSRCTLRAWTRPRQDVALAELERRGEDDAAAVARWCRHAVFDSEPARGLQWTRRLLRQLAAGEPEQIDGVTPAVAIESLQKLGLDVLRVRSGLPPLYLLDVDEPLRRLAKRGDSGAWQAWWQQLTQAARHADFPLHAQLAVQAWVVELRQILSSRGSN